MQIAPASIATMLRVKVTRHPREPDSQPPSGGGGGGGGGGGRCGHGSGGSIFRISRLGRSGNGRGIGTGALLTIVLPRCGAGVVWHEEDLRWKFTHNILEAPISELCINVRVDDLRQDALLLIKHCLDLSL